jgi:hypothetical protein
MSRRPQEDPLDDDLVSKARAGQIGDDFKLVDGSRVAVVGGGPAGAFLPTFCLTLQNGWIRSFA